MRGPSVSVVVRTYSRPIGTLCRCLNSLLNQSVSPKDIIVVHKGLGQQLNKIPNESRLVLVQQNGRGVSNACNEGIAASSGDVVAFIDDDSVASPKWIESLIERYASNDMIVAVGGPVNDGRNGKVSFFQGTVDILGRSYMTPDSARSRKHPLESFEYMALTNASFRRHTLEYLGGFDEFYTYSHEDPDVCIRIQQAGLTSCFEQKALVWHYFAAGPTRSDWIYNHERSRIYFALSNFMRGLSLLMMVKHMFLLQGGNMLNALLQIATRRRSFIKGILELAERELGEIVGFASGIRYRRQHSKETFKKGPWLDRYASGTNRRSVESWRS